MLNGGFPSAGQVGPHVSAVVEEVGGDGVAEDAAFPVVVGEEFHLLPLLLVPAFDLKQHTPGEDRSAKATRPQSRTSQNTDHVQLHFAFKQRRRVVGV